MPRLGFTICAAYGGHIWRNIKIHTASSFGKVQDHRICKMCGREQVRDRFLGAAIRTEGTWRDGVPDGSFKHFPGDPSVKPGTEAWNEADHATDVGY